LEEVQKHLKRLKAYAVKYLRQLLDKYGKNFPRRTEIEIFDKIDRKAVALNNVKVGWDRSNGYIGTNVKSDEQITCTEYDHLLCVERNGNYKVVNIPEKIYIGRLYDFRKYDKATEFGIVYSETKTGKCYAKRCIIDKFITEKDYRICPDGCRLELITPRSNSIYECVIDHKIKDRRVFELNIMDAPLRSAKARGALISSRKLLKITFLRLIEEQTDINNSGENNSTEEESQPDLLSNITSGSVLKTEQEEPDESYQENSEDDSDGTQKQSKSRTKLPSEKKSNLKNEDERDSSSEENGKTLSGKPHGKDKSGDIPKKKIKEGKKHQNPDEEDDWGITQPEFGF